MKRTEIPLTSIDGAAQAIHSALTKRLMEKGFGSFASSHEILGILDEEYDEMRDEVRANDIEGLRNELIDIAVAAQFAIACIDHGDITR